MIYNNDKDANNERDYSIDITINFSYCLGAKSEEDARAKVKELILEENKLTLLDSEITEIKEV